MKNLTAIITLFALLSMESVCAQELNTEKPLKQNLIYGGLHLQGMQYTQIGANLYYLNKLGHGLHYSFSFSSWNSLKEPTDYCVCGFKLKGFKHIDEAYVHELRYQYLLPQYTNRVRFLIEAGISYSRFEILEYQKKETQILCYNDNWIQHNRIGFSCRLTADFPIFRASGFQLSMNANINSYISMAGPQLTWTFGRVRSKI